MGSGPDAASTTRLHALAVGIASTKVNWILDADIAGFFDTLSHDRLIRFVDQTDRRPARDPSDPQMAEGRGGWKTG